MHIAIAGLGYVGLSLACLLSQHNDVTAVDVDAGRVDKINAGELDFATAAESYSKDTASAAEGGNVGWDRLSNLVTEYTTALADLNKGDVSGLVTSTYGIHIIQCTDVFEAPEELTSLDQLPTEFQDSIRTMLQSSNQSNAYYTWLEEQRNAADIQINDMPEGLPYYVDMANYSKTETSTDGTGVTAVDADGNPIVLDEETAEGEGEGAEAPVAEGVDEGAEGAEDAAAAAADEAAADAEGAAPAGDDAAAEQPTEGAADGAQPAEGAAE